MHKEGDALLIQQPVYYPFREVIEDNGRIFVNNQLHYEDGKYTIDFEDFEKKIVDNNVKVFILCNPHNPVGRVWTKEELEKMGLQPANIIIKNPELRAAYRKANAAAGYSQGSIMGQVAVKSVYTKGDEWVNELVEYITGNMNYMRDFVKENFPKAHFVDPEGTYLTWVDFSGYGFTDEELEHIMVEEAHLWLDSGKVFGPATAQFERFNLACPRATVVKAMEQLKAALDNHTKWA